MRLLIRWGIACIALLTTIRLVPGIEMVGEPLWIAIATAILAFLNVCARPVVWVMKLLTIPLSCLTFGLWNLFLALVANAAIFYYVGSHGWGFWVEDYEAAVVGALIMATVSTILNGIYSLVARRDK